MSSYLTQLLVEGRTADLQDGPGVPGWRAPPEKQGDAPAGSAHRPPSCSSR